MVHELDAHLKADGAASAIGLDLVDFKRLNDVYGTSIGDRVLFDVASLLIRVIGDRGWICRAGGEEFIVMVPKASPTVARDLAETLEAVVEQTVFAYPDQGIPELDVRVWSGVTTTRPGFDAVLLFNAAMAAVDETRRIARSRG